MESAALAIARMKGIAEGYGVQQVKVVGTAAVREASNRGDFLTMVREKAGIELEIISAEEEASLAHLSVMRRELETWLTEHEYTSLRQMQGSMNLTGCPNPGAYERAHYMRILQSRHGE